MTLQKIFINQAEKYDSKLCVIDYDDGKSYSYKDILKKSVLLSYIISQDPRLKDEKCLGLILPVCSYHLVVKLAILMNHGKIPVIINYATGLTRNMSYARTKAEVKYFISSKSFFDKLKIPHIDGVIFIEDLFAAAKKESAGVLPSIDFSSQGLKDKLNFGQDSDIAVILFTSGSEKEPKAVPLTHRNIICNLEDIQARLHLKDSEVFASVLPYFHVFGMTTSLWLPVYVGAKNILHPNPLSIQTVLESLSKYQISILLGIPSFFHAYFTKGKKSDFESLRILIAGGDKLPQQLADNYKTHFGKTLYEGYGATELSPVVCLNSEKYHKMGSIGKVLDSIQYKVVDIESGKDVPPGQQGRFLVKGDNVMQGYYKDPENTQKVLVDGWYDTGDIVSADEDGFIFFKGRFKRFVKIAGEMISLMFIESEIAKFMPHDSKFCVIPKEHPVKGSQLILVTDAQIDFEKLRLNLLQELKPIMIPKFLHVVDSLPLSGVGKIDYKKIEKQILELDL